MGSSYFAPLVTLPILITHEGQYRTRKGDIVHVERISKRHDFGCVGYYGGTFIRERWHRSGRLSAYNETDNDIVKDITL